MAMLNNKMVYLFNLLNMDQKARFMVIYYRI